MADIESALVSETAASETQALPDGFPANSSPTGIYTFTRELLAAEKREWNRSHATVTSTGAANAYVVTYTTAPASLINGQRHSFISNFANTGSATANINALGAKTIQKQGASGLANLASGDIQNGQHVHLEYDSGAGVYVLLTPQAPPSNAVANGLTGAATFTAHGVLVGEGTSAIAATSAGTAGQVLTSNGASADPTFQANAPTGGVNVQTANYTIVAGDNNKVVVANKATAITFTMPSGATQAAVYVRNIGAGILTINPNGADTFASGGVTNLTSLQLSQGDSGYLVSDTGAPAVWYFFGSRHYDSGQQTWTSGGLLTLAHGLGIKPSQTFIYFHCTTANLNYSIGDEVMFNPGMTDGGASNDGLSIVPDATNLNVRMGSVTNPALMNKTTGANANITNADWTLVFRSYATN